MRVFREPEPAFGKRILPFLAGSAGGLACGLLLSGRSRRKAAGVQPAYSRHLVGEQTELTAIEDAVLDVFRADEVLGERGIDVGAISRGIIELSGSVWTEDEADRAVHVAGRVAGVDTVIDRLEIEDEARHLANTRQRFESGDPSLAETGWQGRGIGMGSRRQGRETDPDRPDNSQHQEEVAMEDADRDQWVAEGLAAEVPRNAERPEDERPRQDVHYDEDELDNQDPHGKHTSRTLDNQPREIDTAARVGEGPKPGTELRLEEADVPVKPHSGESGPGEEDAEQSGAT